jgi:hypothetical protein
VVNQDIGMWKAAVSARFFAMSFLGQYLAGCLQNVRILAKIKSDNWCRRLLVGSWYWFLFWCCG